jgi:hypothetical protein
MMFKQLFIVIVLSSLALVANTSLLLADESTGTILSKNLSPTIANGMAEYIAPSPEGGDLTLTIHLADLGENQQESLKALKSWIDDAGFMVNSIAHDYSSIEVVATVKTVETSLQVGINKYQVGTRVVFANDKPPTIPDYLNGIVISIDGLDNIDRLPQP